jgi:HlyD family secretion protein
MTRAGRNRVAKAGVICGCLALVGLIAARALHTERVKVRIASPAYHDVSKVVRTNGVVEPTLAFQARANFPGMVEKVFVRLGDRVSAGQMLVMMKDPFAVSRVAAAESALAGAQEANENVARGGSQEERISLNGDLEHAKEAEDSAQHTLDVVRQLQKQGAVGAGEVEDARKRLEDASTTLQVLQERSTKRFSERDAQASQARLADAQAALGAAKIAFSNAHITSTIAGTVYSVSVSPYDFVPMGADLLRVADLHQMQVRAYFDEPEVGKLKAGQPVTITWDGRTGATWHGDIRQAPVGAMPQGSRSVAECVIKVDDSKGDLLPNTNVVVSVSIDEHKNVLTVPRQALQTYGDERFVFRVVDGRLLRTPVRVGLVSLELAEITQGLTPQDVVAVSALSGSGLADHLAISPQR